MARRRPSEKNGARPRSGSTGSNSLDDVLWRLDLEIKQSVYTAHNAEPAEFGKLIRGILQSFHATRSNDFIFSPAMSEKITREEFRDVKTSPDGNPIKMAYLRANDRFSSKPLLLWLARTRMAPLRIFTFENKGGGREGSIRFLPLVPEDVACSGAEGSGPPALEVPVNGWVAKLDSLLRDTLVPEDERVRRLASSISSCVDDNELGKRLDEWLAELDRYFRENGSSYPVEDDSLGGATEPSETQKREALCQIVLIAAYARSCGFNRIDYIINPGVHGRHELLSSAILCWSTGHAKATKARFGLRIQNLMHLSDQTVQHYHERNLKRLSAISNAMGVGHAIGHWANRVSTAAWGHFDSIGAIAKLNGRAITDPGRSRALEDVSSACEDAKRDVQFMFDRLSQFAKVTDIFAQCITTPWRNQSTDALDRWCTNEAVLVRGFVDRTLELWNEAKYLRNDERYLQLRYQLVGDFGDAHFRPLINDDGRFVPRHTNPEILEVVLSELLINAAKYAPMKLANEGDDLVTISIVPTPGDLPAEVRDDARGFRSLRVTNRAEKSVVAQDIDRSRYLIDGDGSNGGLRFIAALIRTLGIGRLVLQFEPSEISGFGEFSATLVGIVEIPS